MNLILIDLYLYTQRYLYLYRRYVYFLWRFTVLCSGTFYTHPSSFLSKHSHTCTFHYRLLSCAVKRHISVAILIEYGVVSLFSMFTELWHFYVIMDGCRDFLFLETSLFNSLQFIFFYKQLVNTSYSHITRGLLE